MLDIQHLESVLGAQAAQQKFAAMTASLAAGSQYQRMRGGVAKKCHVIWSVYVRARERETDGTRYAARALPRRGCRAARPVGLA